MDLNAQIFSLIFSFCYGIIFSFLVNINYNLLFNKKKYFKVIFTAVFIIDMALIYFFVLNIINNGIIHIYFLLLIISGFYISFPFGIKFRKRRKIDCKV